jgi:hypothetical protein
MLPKNLLGKEEVPWWKINLTEKERGGEKVKARKGGRRSQDAISGKRNIVLDGNSTLGQIYNLRASLTLPD